MLKLNECVSQVVREERSIYGGRRSSAEPWGGFAENREGSSRSRFENCVPPNSESIATATANRVIRRRHSQDTNYTRSRDVTDAVHSGRRRAETPLGFSRSRDEAARSDWSSLETQCFQGSTYAVRKTEN